MRYFLSGLVLAAATLPAQTVISAKAGLVHYTEGVVKLDGNDVDTSKVSKFSEMKVASELKTEEGRAEVLLAAPSFVRLGENSGLRMLSTSLAETRFAVTAGTALVEAAEIEKNSSITVVAGGSTITITKAGIYRVDMEPAPALRVYEGEATVTNSGETTVVKSGKLLALNTGGKFLQAKFDNKVGDELYRWSKRRSGYVAMANVAAANSLYTRGYSMTAGSWIWNPYFGMFTCVPMNGFWRSPFGYRYYDPRLAYNIITTPVYQPARDWSSGRTYDSAYGGYNGTGTMSPSMSSGGWATVDSRSSGGYSGGYSGSSSAGASAPAAGGGGDSGSRGGGASSMGGGQSSGGGGGTRGGGGN